MTYINPITTALSPEAAHELAIALVSCDSSQCVYAMLRSARHRLEIWSALDDQLRPLDDALFYNDARTLGEWQDDAQSHLESL